MLVIMAGYPSSDVEEAFTMIQRADRDLRGFPGMAESLPNQYFDFVSKLLNVDAAGRAKCEDILSHPFMDAFVANDQSASLGLPSPHQHDAEHDLSLRVQDEVRRRGERSDDALRTTLRCCVGHEYSAKNIVLRDLALTS